MNAKINPYGTDWLLVRAFINQEIGHAQTRLEGRLTQDETWYERGRIAALRMVLAHGEPEPRTPTIEDTQNYG